MFDEIDRAYFRLRADEERRRASQAANQTEERRYENRACEFENQAVSLEYASPGAS
ncbi:hypothetical protein ACFB49_32930 [Sphingomonas sp. DBB INV C78]|uniref:hypothetical protein n=1 Tax=Sphingomonas sp. DBB INV C78 TaxID=3349434 RepID=UPI0036D21683